MTQRSGGCGRRPARTAAGDTAAGSRPNSTARRASAGDDRGMTTITELPPSRPVLPAARKASLRVHLLGRSVVIMFTAMVGVPLFALWLTLVAVSPISIVAPLVIPATALVRAYANAHRRAAGRLLGRPIEAAYRTPARPGLPRRILTLEGDPASWRDALWLPV